MANLTLYIPLTDQKRMYSYMGTFNRLGITVVSDKASADAVLGLIDPTIYNIADHKTSMPTASMDILLNKDQLYLTGLPTIPTVVIESPQDAPTGTIVKARNSAKGGYVYMPDLGFPIEDLDISFAVNASGQIYTFAEQHITYVNSETFVSSRLADPNYVQELKPKLEAVVAKLNITGGIHNAQFLRYNNEWCLVDWNCRPVQGHTLGLAALYPYMDYIMSFAWGLPLPAQIPIVVLSRPYINSPIPAEKEPIIRAAGLLPRRFEGINGIGVITGVGPSEEYVNSLFNNLESQL